MEEKKEDLRREIEKVLSIHTRSTASSIIADMIIEAEREKPSKEISEAALARGTAEEVGA